MNYKIYLIKPPKLGGGPIDILDILDIDFGKKKFTCQECQECQKIIREILNENDGQCGHIGSLIKGCQ